MERLLYRDVEAARLLGLSRAKVWVLMASGVLPSVHIGRSRRITSDALAQFIRELEAGYSVEEIAQRRAQTAQGVA